MYIYIYICMYVYISMTNYIYMMDHGSLSLYIYIYIYVSLSLSIYIYIYTYIYIYREREREILQNTHFTIYRLSDALNISRPLPRPRGPRASGAAPGLKREGPKRGRAQLTLCRLLYRLTSSTSLQYHVGPASLSFFVITCRTTPRCTTPTADNGPRLVRTLAGYRPKTIKIPSTCFDYGKTHLDCSTSSQPFCWFSVFRT